MSDRTEVDDRIDLYAALNRRDVVEALRSGKHKQCFHRVGNYRTPSEPVCWVGVVYRILGFRVSIQDALGITPLDMYKLITLNNEGLTFPQLADEMEKLSPPIKNT